MFVFGQVASRWFSDYEGLVELDISLVWIVRWFVLQDHQRPLGEFHPKEALVCPMPVGDSVWWDPRPPRRRCKGPVDRGWGNIEDESDHDIDDDDSGDAGNNNDDDFADEPADVCEGELESAIDRMRDIDDGPPLFQACTVY